LLFWSFRPLQSPWSQDVREFVALQDDEVDDEADGEEIWSVVIYEEATCGCGEGVSDV
jgi:hypothetical protein